MKALKVLWILIRWWIAVPLTLFAMFPGLFHAIQKANTALFPGAAIVVYATFMLGLRSIVEEIREIWHWQDDPQNDRIVTLLERIDDRLENIDNHTELLEKVEEHTAILDSIDTKLEEQTA